MNNSNHKERRTGYAFFLILIFLAAGIVTGGYFAYRSYEKNYRIEIEQQLSTIAESKVDQLVQWRKERIGDGQFFYKNELFSAIVKRYIHNQNDRDAKRGILSWVRQVQRVYNYDLMMLLDAQWNTILVFPENKERARLIIDKKNTEILLSGNIAFQDFYRNDQDQHIYLKILVPILEEFSSKRLIGVLALRISPEEYLYPLIQKWPTPSITSETLIIRRDGNDALFLNDLKFYKDAALNLRIPLESKDVLAVKAALGTEGIVEGIDYRGVPVIGDVRAVPDSPWFLVARMDMGEVYVSLRERLWLMIVLVGILLIGTSVSVSFVWLQQRNRFYREQYKLAEALRESESRFRQLTESLPQLVWTCQPDGPCDYLNRKWVEFTGVPEAQQHGFGWLEQLHPDDRAPTVAAWEAAVAARADFRVEFRIRRHDGEYRWFDTQAVRLSVADGHTVKWVGSNTDVTERKRAEEKILKLNAELEHRVMQRTSQLEVVNRELEAFSYSVSHDLRAPLRHVSGYVELLGKQYQTELPEKGRHYLDEIIDSVRQMGLLIDDLLKFSRSGRAEIHESTVDMNRIVEEVSVRLRQDNPQRDIEWSIAEMPSVHCDDAMMHLVWENLLSNAVKFTGTRKKARIEIGVRDENKEFVFSVCDNGVGFDMKYAQKLFGVFQRLHSIAEFEGTGVGLANVKRIIARHGGRTWAEAELDKGASFYFSIPK